MSTPTLAATMLPVHHAAYGYPQYSTTSSRAYPTNNTLPAPPRLHTTYNSIPHATQYHQPQQSSASLKQPSYAPSMASTEASGTARDKRPPNWTEFYKNGVPKEIIVIDDDSPPPHHTLSHAHDQRQDTYSNIRKRKIDHGYEVADSPVYSTYHAQYGSSSSSVSVHSGARTNSIQTVTAPTSLESYSSNPASNSYEDMRIGQKRKRVVAPKETRQSTKRKQQEAQADPYLDYVPPQMPPRKAAEVHVPVIRDVRLSARNVGYCTDLIQNLTKHQKVDDEDGHYIIEEGLPLTDRCKSCQIVPRYRANVCR